MGPRESDTPGLLDARRARWLVAFAAILWSTSGFFVKSPYLAGWEGDVLAFWRALFAGVALLPLVRNARLTWKLVPMAAFFAAMNYTYLTAMVLGSAANAIWLQLTAPVWVLLVGVFVFGERAIKRDWLLVLFAMAGVGVILYHESQGANVAAVLWGLASGVAYAGVVLSLRQLRAIDSVWLAALNNIVTALVFAPIALGSSTWPSGIQWIVLALFGIGQIALPYVLFARSLRSISGHEATAIGLIEPLLVPVWVFSAWGERPAWWTFVGGGLILCGLAIRYLDPRRKKPDELVAVVD